MPLSMKNAWTRVWQDKVSMTASTWSWQQTSSHRVWEVFVNKRKQTVSLADSSRVFWAPIATGPRSFPSLSALGTHWHLPKVRALLAQHKSRLHSYRLNVTLSLKECKFFLPHLFHLPQRDWAAGVLHPRIIGWSNQCQTARQWLTMFTVFVLTLAGFKFTTSQPRGQLSGTHRRTAAVSNIKLVVLVCFPI